MIKINKVGDGMTEDCNKQKFIKVDEWEPTEQDNIIKYDNKLIIIPFDKIFNKQYIQALNTFIIKKDSYVKRLGNDPILGKGICHYINYFIKFYDNNNELLMTYAKLKYMIDRKSQKIKLKSYIKALYMILFTDSMKEKISKMIEDNYYIDLTSSDGKQYTESLEFTNEHAKIMMKISLSMKIMVPVLFHYVNSYNILKEKKYLYQFYEPLFSLYSDTINIYNKLYISTLAQVNKNYNINPKQWAQREINGIDPLTYLNELLRDKIISETMFKYTFEKNIINFNSVVLRKQLEYFIKEKYDYTPIELTNVKNEDGLSGLDKLEMNSNKIDESLIILSDINIKKTIKRIKKRMNIKINDEELNFYKKFHKINKFQVQLVFYFYAKYFGGFRDLNLLTRKQYLMLLILLKLRLQLQGNVYLPQILTGNIQSKLNTRTIQNTKFLMKIENSSIYQTLMKDKFFTLDELKKSNLILNLLSTVLNTTFTFVDYNSPEILGDKIEINSDIVSDEFLNFLNQL
jgi:hypothetical protein